MPLASWIHRQSSQVRAVRGPLVSPCLWSQQHQVEQDGPRLSTCGRQTFLCLSSLPGKFFLCFFFSGSFQRRSGIQECKRLIPISFYPGVCKKTFFNIFHNERTLHYMLYIYLKCPTCPVVITVFPMQGVMGSVPGQRTLIPHAPLCTQ